MRAAICRTFGGPVEVRDIPVPRPSPGEVLLRMKATSLNAWDHDIYAGTAQGRLGNFRRPQHEVLGADLAGIVEETGPDVTRLKVGDAVFGDCSSSNWGGMAEYAVAAEKYLSLKSNALSFEQAAALPQAGLLALQGLRHGGAVEAGDRVLVNGGGGGMGHFAIHLAKQAGAVVTGVDRAGKFESMRRAGADRVIDFQAADFTAGGDRYDLILDPVASRPMRDYARALTERGRLVVVGGTVRALLGALIVGGLMSRKGGRRFGIVPLNSNVTDLEELQHMVEDGRLTPALDRVYALNEAEAALGRFRTGDICGKVIVKIAD